MPGGDGTGPGGLGPMTGRAAGYCAGYSVPGYMNLIPGRGGFGYGRGWGRGFGRGFGWRGAAYPYAYGYYSYTSPYGGYPYAPDMAPQQEADMLKEQAKAIQGELKSINERIGKLESVAKTEKKM